MASVKARENNSWEPTTDPDPELSQQWWRQREKHKSDRTLPGERSSHGDPDLPSRQRDVC